MIKSRMKISFDRSVQIVTCVIVSFIVSLTVFSINLPSLFLFFILFSVRDKLLCTNVSFVFHLFFFTKGIDFLFTLRNKFKDDKEKLKALEGINLYIEEMEKMYQKAS